MRSALRQFLAGRLASEAPAVHVLTTSRDALRAQGEDVQRVWLLDCPPQCATLAAAEALGYPAAQLFMERATAGGYDFECSDAEVGRYPTAVAKQNVANFPPVATLACGTVAGDVLKL